MDLLSLIHTGKSGKPERKAKRKATISDWKAFTRKHNASFTKRRGKK